MRRFAELDPKTLFFSRVRCDRKRNETFIAVLHLELQQAAQAPFCKYRIEAAGQPSGE
jgi:hypothetical protein